MKHRVKHSGGKKHLKKAKGNRKGRHSKKLSVKA
jgi:hypothetical protein